MENLSLWTLDAEMKSLLTPLTAHGVGAIYLDYIDAPFSFKDSSNALQAESRKAGLFLSDDMTAGLIQQIDLAV